MLLAKSTQMVTQERLERPAICMQEKSSEIAYFGDSQAYQAFIEEDYDRIIELGLANSGAGPRVLDLGCGSGAFGKRIAALGHTVIGADISPNLLAFAPSESIGRVQCDVERMPFQANAYDLVFCGGVLHHFPAKALVLREVSRVLKAGGELICVEPNRNHLATHLYYAVLSRLGFFNPISPNEFPIAPFDLQREFENHNLTVTRSVGLNATMLDVRQGALVRVLRQVYLGVLWIVTLVSRKKLKRYNHFLMAARSSKIEREHFVPTETNQIQMTLGG
jgi:ubiquinone/menaquinone biosynthesis C-methylase UbiE